MKYVLLLALILGVFVCVCMQSRDIVKHHNQLQTDINTLNKYHNELLESHNKLVNNYNIVIGDMKDLITIALRNGDIIIIDPNNTSVKRDKSPAQQLSQAGP